MNSQLEKLLHDLVNLSGLTCTVQGEQAVAELFFNTPGEAQLSFLDGWGTIETAGYHVHFKTNDLRNARFIEEAGSCQFLATYVTFLDNEGRERIRFYFANPSDTTREYSPQELAHFENLRTTYGSWVG